MDFASMDKLQLIHCPLCSENKRSVPVRVPAKDDHIDHYGDLYRGKKKSEWRICGKCGFVFQNPRPTKEALNHFYASSSYHADEIPEGWWKPERFLEFAHWYYDEKIDYVTRFSGLKVGTVCDIGFGHGGALRLFQDRGWKSLGTEPDARLFQFAKNIAGLSEISNCLFKSDIDLANQVDLIFSNHTFEHLADLDDVMLGIRKVLKPGGHIFTAIPTYYRNRTTNSKGWMNSAHYSLFTHRSLNQLFARYGMEEIAHTYRGFTKEFDEFWHVARYTGRTIEPEQFFENPARVNFYMAVVNPLNSLRYFPLDSPKMAGFRSIVRLGTLPFRAAWILFTSPAEFKMKVQKRLTPKS